MHHHGEVGRAFNGCNTELADDVRQTRQRLVDAVLYELLRLVGVGADLEADGKRHLPVGSSLREHIQHVFDAVDLLFEWCSDSSSDHFRVGAGIGGVHDDRWRHHVRIFRNRQFPDGECAADKDQQRKYAGENRTVDKEI